MNPVNVSTMRRIDRWVGVPCCLLLTLLRKIAERWARKPAPGQASRILFVKLAEQGATVLAYPAIRQAVDRVGRENVFFLFFEENRFILDVMQVIPAANVITIPTSGLWWLIRGIVHALSRVRRIRPDVAIDFEFFARGSAILTYLSGANLRVGLHRSGDRAPWRGDLMTHRLKYDPNLHTTELYSAMVQAIDRPPGSLTFDDLDTDAFESELPAFCPSREELAKVEATVHSQAGSSDYSPLVLLNANASDLLPLRRWPSDRYAELARGLIARYSSIHVAFTGAPAEADVAEELVAAVGSERCFSMAGKTTLRELMVLYCLADVMVTNDSGPAHFAALTPIQVVTLFGPETPARFGSRSPRSRIIWKDAFCSPCVDAYNNRLSKCRDNQCMQQISVDEVLDAVVDALASRPG